MLVEPKEKKNISTILFDDEVKAFLKQEKKRTKYSMSELVNKIVANYMAHAIATNADENPA